MSCRGTVLYGKHLLHPRERPAAASILFLQGFGDHCNSPYHAEQVMRRQLSSFTGKDTAGVLSVEFIRCAIGMIGCRCSCWRGWATMCTPLITRASAAPRTGRKIAVVINCSFSAWYDYNFTLRFGHGDQQGRSALLPSTL